VRKWRGGFNPAVVFCAFALSLSSLAQGFHLLETAEMGPRGYHGGISISSDQYIGAAFTVRDITDLSHVGGHFTAGPNGAAGPIFAALIELQNAGALPKGDPFAANEILATALLTTPAGAETSREVTVPMPLRLLPGNYMLVFGSGRFGATGQSGLPTVNRALRSPTFAVYGGPDASWDKETLHQVGNPNSTLRIVVQAVPEAKTLSLLFFGLTFLLASKLRRQ
jgi:hypothetical protein